MSRIGVTVDGEPHIVEIDLRTETGPERTVVVDGVAVRVSLPERSADDPLEWMVIDGRPYEVVVDPSLRWIRSSSGLHRLEVRDLESGAVPPESGDGRVKAPIPGRIVRVSVREGETVVPGQTLLVLEAMKMENPIPAPRGGVVKRVAAHPGQKVVLGELLAEIDPG